jgi:hypothetical protein
LDAEIVEVFGQLGVLGKFCSKSELLTQKLAFFQKAMKMAFFKSRVKTVLFGRKDAQNAQKSAKNDEKSVLFGRLKYEIRSTKFETISKYK